MTFYSNAFNKIKNDTKQVFNLANKILFRQKSDGLPSVSNLKEQATEFNEFFIEKIDLIRKGLENIPVSKKSHRQAH